MHVYGHGSSELSLLRKPNQHLNEEILVNRSVQESLFASHITEDLWLTFANSITKKEAIKKNVSAISNALYVNYCLRSPFNPLQKLEHYVVSHDDIETLIDWWMANSWMNVLKDIYARKAKLNYGADRFNWKHKYVAVSATWVLTKNISSHLRKSMIVIIPLYQWCGWTRTVVVC